MKALEDWIQRQWVEDIKTFPKIRDTKSLRRFLGMIDFYRKLIPRAAGVLLPVKEAIKLNLVPKTLDFNAVERQAIVNIKDILAQVSALTSYLPTPPLKQDMTQGQFFKRNLTGLNSEFSFS